MEIVLVHLDDACSWLAEVERKTPRLSKADDERANAIQSSETDRRRWRTARIATRIILERWCQRSIAGTEFLIGASGRPRLNIPNAPEFSISHSDEYALVAVTGRGPLGVDIQLPRSLQINEKRAQRIIQLGEELVGKPFDDLVEQNDRLLSSWVRIEAVAKALEVGISTLLNSARVFGPEKKQSPDALERAVKALRLHDLKLPAGAFGCLACGGLTPTSDVLTFPQNPNDLEGFLARPANPNSH